MKGGRGTINVGYPYRVYPNQWLHSDIKDVSYFFNFKFYQKSNLKEVYKESSFYSIVVFGLVYGNGIAYEQ